VKFIAPFNRFEVLSSDLEFMQAAQSNIDPLLPDGALDRFKDKTDKPGIVIPAGATVADIQNGIAAQFTITDSGGGNIDVDLGQAYDSDGERIVIQSGDTVTFDANAPNFTTDGISGGGTPFSTGRIDIPPGGTPGDNNIRFVFISHLPVVRTLALPPDHESKDGDISGATDNRKPITGLDAEQGVAYAHHIIDGYKIVVVEVAAITTDSENVPQLVADSTAIFIGRYVSDSPSTVGGIVHSDATYRRPILRVRPHVAVKIDSADKPVLYADGQFVTYKEHITAIGSGVIKPTNPHGIDLIDLITTSLEPTLAAFQDEAMGNGLTDKGIEALARPINSPIDPSQFAANVTISVTGIDVFSATIRAGSATGGVVTLDAKAYEKMVRVDQLSSVQRIYVDGDRLTSLSPTIAEITGGGGDDGIVPFSTNTPSPDTTGLYKIFVMVDPDNAGVGLLGKVLDTASLDEDRFLLVKVYWDGTNVTLIKSEFNESVASPQDFRNFGVINTPQIATEAIRHATKGLLAQQVFANSLGNADFRLAADAGTYADSDVWGWTADATVGSIVRTRSTSPPDSFANGPKTDMGLKVDLTKSGEDLDVGLFGELIAPIKPNTKYTITAWLLVTSGNNVNMQVDYMQDEDNKGISVTTGAQDISLNATDRDSQWKRVAVPIITNASASVTKGTEATPKPHLLKIRFHKGNSDIVTLNDGDIYLASVVILEGEWVANYIGPRCYSGEIFMWDRSASCPPGSIEVTAMRGRLPVGDWDAGGANIGDTGGATPQTGFSPAGNLIGTALSGTASGAMSGSITVATGVDGAHGHLPGTSQAGFGAAPVAWVAIDPLSAHQHNLTNQPFSGNMSSLAISGTVNNDGVDMPEYAVRFCRRL
jgi:hypothetical protein